VGGDRQAGQADDESDGWLVQADADPSATSASPWLLVRRLALSSSSLPSASSIQAPMPIAPAAELVGARLQASLRSRLPAVHNGRSGAVTTATLGSRFPTISAAMRASPAPDADHAV
jgi:hypothetical protein